MSEEDIKKEFQQAIHTRGLGLKTGLTKDQVYDYKNREQSVGTMLEFLWRLGKIDFV